MFVDTQTMHICNYCGKLNAEQHKHHKNRCVDCGKLYDRYRKARRRSVASEMILCGERMLQRGQTGAPGLRDTFYKRISDDLTALQKTIKEANNMAETHKTCKQCGRYLPIDEFRKYVPRGRGIYKTTQGRHTICKTCESISARASTALSKGDEATISKLRDHYKILQDRGYEPATAPARRILGVDITPEKRQRNTLDDMLSITQGVGESEIDKHCRLVRQRGYKSFEEADAAHRRLAAELQHAMPDVYEEINNLMDEWYIEG